MDPIGNIYVGDGCALRMVNNTGLKMNSGLKWIANKKTKET